MSINIQRCINQTCIPKMARQRTHQPAINRLKNWPESVNVLLPVGLEERASSIKSLETEAYICGDNQLDSGSFRHHTGLVRYAVTFVRLGLPRKSHRPGTKTDNSFMLVPILVYNLVCHGGIRKSRQSY